MVGQTNANDEDGFKPGQHYTFDPHVTTNAAPPGGNWTTKTFAAGKCMRYEPKAEAHMFIGNPVGEDRPYFFAVKWGGGSIAKEVTAPAT